MLRDEDFDALYKEGGRPPVSPRILALATVMQTVDRIPDREAAYDASVRLDWQVIFGVQPGWESFDPSLLTVFRRRMLDHPQVKDIFDRVLERLVELKLVRPEGKQRLDSTWVFGLLRTLSRLENLKEALRVAVRAIEAQGESGEAIVKQLPRELWKRAIGKMDLRGLDGQERQQLTLRFGEDIFLLLRQVEAAQEPIRSLTEIQTLRKIFEQNFSMHHRKKRRRGKPAVRLTLRDFTETVGTERISSPHEPEARYNGKADKGRGAIGYKLQVAETAEAEAPNFITAVEATGGATPDDGQARQMVGELKSRGVAPKDLHVDSGYVSAKERKHLQKNEGVRLVGPTKPEAAKGIASDSVRVPVERTIREMVANGARRSPYRGKVKTRWWERLVGAVVNLKRLGRAELDGLLKTSTEKLCPQPT
jgi:hypothetical protein